MPPPAKLLIWQSNGGNKMPKNQNEKSNPIESTLPLGLSLGVTFGIIFHQLALGISLGLCFGLALGAFKKNKAK